MEYHLPCKVQTQRISRVACWPRDCPNQRCKGLLEDILINPDIWIQGLEKTVQEVKFISQVLESLEIEYRKPIRVHVDNVGAIFLSENRNLGERTKHVDIKYHYIREQIDVGLIEVKFVKSEENLADLFIKNLKGELFECHASKLVAERDKKEGF